MKAGCLLLLTGLLQAGEIDGTVWYDSKGQIVVVDGPAAKKAPAPWLPQWVAREARRDRALRGGYRRSRSWSNDIYPVWGWSYAVGYRRPTPCLPLPCARPFQGASVIIR